MNRPHSDHSHRDSDLDPGGHGPSRRLVLGAGAAGAAGAALSLAPTAAAEAASSPDRRQLILQIAQAGGVFPDRLGNYRSDGPNAAAVAHMRARHQRFPNLGVCPADFTAPTQAAVTTAAAKLPTAQLKQAWAGADLALGKGLRNVSTGRLIDGLAQLYGGSAADARGRLETAVTLAVLAAIPTSTVPGAQHAAHDWLGLLSVMSARGTLRGSLQRGRIS